MIIKSLRVRYGKRSVIEIMALLLHLRVVNMKRSGIGRKWGAGEMLRSGGEKAAVSALNMRIHTSKYVNSILFAVL